MDHSNHPYFIRLQVSLLFAAAALLLIFQVNNYDIYWHLANGRAMLGSGEIVNQEIFSYTKNGTEFTNHEWLAQVIFFLAYNALGGTGLIALKLGLLLLSLGLLYRTSGLLGANPLLTGNR